MPVSRRALFALTAGAVAAPAAVVAELKRQPASFVPDARTYIHDLLAQHNEALEDKLWVAQREMVSTDRLTILTTGADWQRDERAVREYERQILLSPLLQRTA